MTSAALQIVSTATTALAFLTLQAHLVQWLPYWWQNEDLKPMFAASKPARCEWGDMHSFRVFPCTRTTICVTFNFKSPPWKPPFYFNIVDVTTEIGAPTLVRSTTIILTGVAPRSLFKWFAVLCTASWWPYHCVEASKGTNIASFRLSSLYRLRTWSDSNRWDWVHIVIVSWSHRRSFVTSSVTFLIC